MEKVAVIILNWNGLELTRNCIKKVLRSTYAPVDIYVLDNGSSQDEAYYLKQEFAEKITIRRSEKNLGFAGGNNYVVSTMLPTEQYAYYLLLNQDTDMEPSCIESLVLYMQQHTEVAVSGPLVVQPDRATVQSFGASINLRTGKIISRYQSRPIAEIPTTPEQVDCVIGNCFMVRSTVVTEIGLFDEMYFAYYEEADWCLRVRERGYVCAVVPQAIIVHSKSGGFRTYLNVRNMIWFEKRFAHWTEFTFFILYFWIWFIPERLKKGSRLKELFRASLHGWLGLHKGLFN